MELEQSKEAEIGRISIQKRRSWGVLDKKSAPSRTRSTTCQSDQIVKERWAEMAAALGSFVHVKIVGRGCASGISKRCRPEVDEQPGPTRANAVARLGGVLFESRRSPYSILLALISKLG